MIVRKSLISNNSLLQYPIEINAGRTSYGSTITDGGERGYQSADQYTGISPDKSIPLTIENPMYRNYR